MIFHQKNLLWDEGVLLGPLFCRLYFFSNLAEWNKQLPSPVALQARNPLVSSSQNNVLRRKCLANLILVDHFLIFDCLLLFYPMGNLIVFVGERFTIALFSLPKTLVNSNWNSNNQVIRSSEKKWLIHDHRHNFLSHSLFSHANGTNSCNGICRIKTESGV